MVYEREEVRRVLLWVGSIPVDKLIIHPTRPDFQMQTIIKLFKREYIVTYITVSSVTQWHRRIRSPFLQTSTSTTNCAVHERTCLGTRAEMLSVPDSVLRLRFFIRSLVLSISASCIASRIKSPSSGDCSISWRKWESYETEEKKRKQDDLQTLT